MTRRGKDFLDSSFQQGKSSGEGYELYLPKNPVSADKLSANPSDVVLFREMGAVTDRLIAHRSLLVWGEPGEGKSHLRDDITMAGAASNDIPFLMVSCHINGAKEKGPAVIRDKLQELREISDETKLVVFDNLDYVGYKGKHRTRTRARDYAQRMSPLVEEVINDDSLITLGFIHDKDWRRQRWVWANPGNPDELDPEIYPHAHNILDQFSQQYEFEGWLTDFGLHEVVEEAGGSRVLLDAIRSVEGLKRFFYARHLDHRLYAENPQLAIEKIEQTRLAMKRV